MSSVLALTAGIKESDDLIGRRMHLVTVTIRDRKELKDLHSNTEYVAAVAAYNTLCDGLVKFSGDMVGLSEHVAKIRTQARVVAQLVEDYYAKTETPDTAFGMARVQMFYPPAGFDRPII
ncbi:hypothetical protein FDI21_gp113 [Pseudomonas phage Noxifer]|uniref:Uncharacterized protein n=1 Tax=Pseudomonas phage Noxifer TaxID=2006684 RepID=A0A1Y0SUU5_9CAUD|nr:hypothetical protein FDI21_gp113 [Pseudomonas phage Noxifer]ARV77282.1 hypothetical protein NOXIFER_113 [Pseudomonas phage Noxifer]